MAIAYVNSAGNDLGGVSSRTLTLSGVTSGNLVVLCVCGDGSSVSSVTDSSGNTVSTALTYAQGQTDVLIGCYYVKNASSGTHTFTVTFAGSITSTLIALEYSGADTASPLDNTPSIVTANNTTPVTVSATPSVTGDLALAFGASSTAAATVSSWTNSFATRTNAGSARPMYVGELIVSGTAAQSTTMTWGTSGYLAASMVLFKAGSGTPPAELGVGLRRPWFQNDVIVQF